jgi:rhodanese-related sulfurtransferase
VEGPYAWASAVDALLAASRAGLDRVEPGDLAAELAAGALVVDTRPVEQRQRDGDLPGAVIVDRNVLEWRLDPTSPHRIPEATGPDLRVIVVCNQGYSSSLAAATLRRLGLLRATDLAGGFQAWLRMPPAVPPQGSGARSTSASARIAPGTTR